MGLLDELRDIPERTQWRAVAPAPAAAAGMPLSAVVAAGGRATTALSRRVRVLLWVMIPVTAAIAVLNPLLADALASGSAGGDPFAFAAWLMRAPHPLLQPGLLAAVAMLLLVLAAVTRGFSRVTTTTSRLATTAAVIGLVAAIPFVLVLLAFAVLMALAAALGAAIVIALVSR